MIRLGLLLLGLPLLATTSAEPLITEFMAVNESNLKDHFGNYEDWIEIHNPENEPANLTGYYLTDNAEDLTQWQFPETTIPGKGYLLVFASGREPDAQETNNQNSPKERMIEAGIPERFIDHLNPQQVEQILNQMERRLHNTRKERGHYTIHTNFKLDKAGEYLALVKPDGETVCHAYGPEYPAQRADLTFGLIDGEKPSRLFTPTPGEANSEALLGFVMPARASRTHGYAEEPFELVLSCSTPDAVIRYTVNGDDPTEETGTLYQGPLEIDRTTVLRAAAFKEGYKPAASITQSYLFLDDIIAQSDEEAPGEDWPSKGRTNGQVIDYGMDPNIVGKLHPKEEVKEALKSLPVMSIVTSVDHLFGRRKGIYVHAGQRGRLWERPASLELITNDGSEGFQIVGGVRIRGGFSRQGRNPKHCFRFIFRKDYGSGKLKYPLFGDEGVDEFDHIDLRSSMNYSWAFGGHSSNNLLRDVFSRDLQGDMGQPYTRSRYYHLYLNGHYWGIYMTQERSEASYAVSYLGGEKADYDVIKTFGQVVEGNRKSYDRLYRLARTGFKEDAAYFEVQGLNPDGSPNPEYERLVDVDNLIDYMLITFYTGDKDGPGGTFSIGNNYWAVYNRENPDGYKFFEHDSEHSLDTGANDMTDYFNNGQRGNPRQSQFNPHWLHERLAENKHYRRRMTERIEKHFFDGGPLSYEACLARLERRERTIEKAIIAHSARWGDAARQGNPRTINHWRTSVGKTKEWMLTREEEVLRQLTERGWYNGVPAPQLNRRQGTVAASFKLYVTEGEGEIYYTTDGTDPKGDDDKPVASAKLVGIPKLEKSTVLGSPVASKALVPQDDSVDHAWTAVDFDDSNWTSGRGGIGYEAKSGYEDLIGIDLRRKMHNENTTAYLRIPFQIGDPAALEFDEFHLKMKYDDGFIAYLNGTRIAAANDPENPNWRSTASDDHGDDFAVEFVDFPLKDAIKLLEPGKNVLAVHGMDGPSSSDFIIVPELEGRTYRGADPIPLSAPETTVRLRAHSEGKWSPIVTARYTVTP